MLSRRGLFRRALSAAFAVAAAVYVPGTLKAWKPPAWGDYPRRRFLMTESPGPKTVALFEKYSVWFVIAKEDPGEHRILGAFDMSSERLETVFAAVRSGTD